MKLSELAQSLGLEHRGADLPLASVAPVEEAGLDQLSFVTAKKWLAQVEPIGAVVVPSDLADEPELADKPLLISRCPPLDAARAARLLGQAHLTFSGIHPTAVVAESAQIGAGVVIGAGAVIGAEVVVGDQTEIHAGTVIYDRCEIGSRCILKANSVIGGEGFGYEFMEGRLEPITHFGTVLIEDDVHVGSGTTIDRARFGETRIGAGTRIDNQVQIAHNVQIGRCCIIVSQVGIAGSCIIGDGAVLAGQAGLVPHTTVGAGARVGASTGVATDVPAGATWTGWWGQSHRESMMQLSAMRKLPAFMKTVRDFMKQKKE
ncbi:MAG: UDP-3-O-(3-hydroxymyristoyl)glucosamine N-acyltransferase [Magnetococcales bacterium]|nr:UDP-3-O-(3-hydroxymyristoyl)glucosamine N-acyltransferase [Magnetococcales bacterium]